MLFNVFLGALVLLHLLLCLFLPLLLFFFQLYVRSIDILVSLALAVFYRMLIIFNLTLR
jgi:hypothetical protein